MGGVAKGTAAKALGVDAAGGGGGAYSLAAAGELYGVICMRCCVAKGVAAEALRVYESSSVYSFTVMLPLVVLVELRFCEMAQVVQQLLGFGCLKNGVCGKGSFC